MNDKYRIVACPTCGKPVEWRPENLWRPFCGERCKLIDLGDWATERYRVPAEQTPPGERGEPD
ncbi:MAG: DNA gyrase inhibitor YacG [Thiobacillaceae bacterium]|jgi:hypothetical protein|nr:DNA gyrase inhibitor YacG [Thiobacillaceae bacterium]